MKNVGSTAFLPEKKGWVCRFVCVNLASQFREALFAELRNPATCDVLRDVSLTGDLSGWTRQLTASCVLACCVMGWRASAKGHLLELLPIARCEYLGLDIVAFAENDKRWLFPTAVMELENSSHQDQIAYSLWKVLCVRAALRLVFCYRRQPEDGPKLVRHLRQEVIGSMGVDGRVTLGGQTVVVVGTRDDAATFPYGFFTWWALDPNTGDFDRM
jgi:hypothetical protein